MGFLFNVDPFVRFFHSDLWSFIVCFETVTICLLRISAVLFLLPVPLIFPGPFTQCRLLILAAGRQLSSSVANAGAHTYTLTTGAEAGLRPSFSLHFTIGLSGPSLHLFSLTSFSLNMFHMGFGTDTWFSISIHQPKYINSFCCP